MERRDIDELLILGGVIYRDNSNRIAEMTQNADEYAIMQQLVSEQALSLVAGVEQRVDAAYADLKTFLAATKAHLQEVLAQGQAQAVQARAQLEALLTATSSAQIMQDDLDRVDMQIQQTTLAAQAVRDRLQQTSDSGD